MEWKQVMKYSKYKKAVLSLAMLAVLAGHGMTAMAANVVQIPRENLDGVYAQGVQSNQYEGWPAGPQTYCEAGIVMDMDNGAILYAKNIDDQHYPASITKLLTALVALEHTKMTDTVTVKQEDISFLTPGDSHIGLKPGEELSMEDAMYGMLLASGNEAAHAIASNTEGGYDNFIRMMNEKVTALGGTNSHFVNPHGLFDPEQYTSARDMALIGAEVFKYEKFREITKTLQYTIQATNITNETRTFQQNHKMLFKGNPQYYYEYCEGGKTGYTDESLNTLVTYAGKDGMNLVAVVLRTHGGFNNAYGATRDMLDYAFNNFTKIPVTADMAATDGVKSISSGDHVTLPSEIAFSDLESTVNYPEKGRGQDGTIEYSYKGVPVGKVRMTISKEYYNQLYGMEETDDKTQPTKQNAPVFSVVLKVILVIAGIVAILFFLLCLLALRARKIRNRKRRSGRQP